MAAAAQSYKWGSRESVQQASYEHHSKPMIMHSSCSSLVSPAGTGIFFNTNLSCRFQPSPGCLILCKDRNSGEGCVFSSGRNARREPLKRGGGCQSSITDTFSSSIHKLPATTSTTTSYNNINTHTDIPSFTRRPEDDEVGVQELTVYEVNECDRGSPVLLFSSKLAVDWYNRLQVVGGLGDLVPFTNKLFDGSLKKRLGITAGIISVIRYYPEQEGLLFESVYSFYFGDYGHISVKGPYKTHEDTILTVTGGSGIFTGVYGTVKIHNVDYPIVLFYTFKLYGIPQLPQALRWDTLPPSKGVRPSPNASLPGVALPNFTD